MTKLLYQLELCEENWHIHNTLEHFINLGQAKVGWVLRIYTSSCSRLYLPMVTSITETHTVVVYCLTLPHLALPPSPFHVPQLFICPTLLTVPLLVTYFLFLPTVLSLPTSCSILYITPPISSSAHYRPTLGPIPPCYSSTHFHQLPHPYTSTPRPVPHSLPTVPYIPIAFPDRPLFALYHQGHWQHNNTQ